MVCACLAPPPPDLTNRPGTLISLGETTPEVAFTTIDGRAVRLGDLRGQVVLLNFFATWCGPCKMELPELQHIWNEYRGRDDFEMFVIGREESAETVRAFKDEHGFTFPMASDPDREAYSHFATKSIPRTYVISQDGKIVYEVTGYYPDEISTLKNVLKQEIAKRKRNQPSSHPSGIPSLDRFQTEPEWVAKGSTAWVRIRSYERSVCFSH